MHVGGNRNATNRPVGHDGRRGWSHGLCDCFSSCGTCTYNQHQIRATFACSMLTTFRTHFAVGCKSWCCPCIVFGQNKERLRNLATHGTPLRGGGSMCNGDCFVYCCLDALAGFGWIMQVCWDVDKMHIHPLTPPALPRLALVARFAIAMAFVEARWATAARCFAAVRVLSRRKAGKLSWRSTVSRDDGEVKCRGIPGSRKFREFCYYSKR